MSVLNVLEQPVSVFLRQHRRLTPASWPSDPAVPGSPDRRSRRVPSGRFRRVVVALLVAFALVVTSQGVADARPPASRQQEAPQPAAPVPAGAATTPGLVSILQPARDQLVSGRPLRIVVRTAKGVSKPTVTLDEGRVTTRLHRRGNTWVGSVPRVPAGVNHLTAAARLGSARGFATARVVVAGPSQNLITRLPSTTRELGYAASPGVRPLAFRTPSDATVTARLNGRAVQVSRAAADRVRTVLLSRADGLRRGRNVLVLTSYLEDGRFERQRFAFKVSGTTPLAEAGPGTVAVRAGQIVRLDASTSVPGTRGNRLSYRWQVRQPISGPRNGLTAPQKPASATTTVRATAGGHYVVSLRVTEHRRGRKPLTSTDLIRLTATESAPALGEPLQTFVADPDSGQGVGLNLAGSWSSWSDLFGDAPAGIVALDARQLTLSAGQQGIAADDKVDSTIRSFLGKTAAGDIVVVVGRDGCCAGSSLLPRSGPFSYVFSSPGRTADAAAIVAPFTDNRGMWNRGLDLGNGAAQGGVTGRVRLGLAATNDQDGFRFVQDDRLRFSTAAPSRATTADEEGAIYRLRAPDTDQVAAAPGPQRGALTLQARSADLGQQWRMVRVYGQFYKLVNHGTGLCLTLDRTATAAVEQDTCDSGPQGADQPPQLWLPQYTSDGWKLRSATTPTADVGVVITRTASGLVVRPEADDDHQLWAFDIPPGLYTITNASTGAAVTEPDYDRSNGSQLVTAPATNELTQQWRVIDKPGGSFALQNVASGLCMDVPGGVTTSGTEIERYTCDPNQPDQPNQRWRPVATPQGLSLLPFGADPDAAAPLVMDDQGNRLVQRTYVQTGRPGVPATAGWALNRQPDPEIGGTYTMAGALRDGGVVTAAGGSEVRTQPVTAPAGAQNWTIADAGDGAVRLVNRTSGQCLVRTGSDTSVEGSVTQQGACEAGSGLSSWRLTRQVDGSYALQAATGSKVLTRADDGVTLAASEDAGAQQQRWTLHGRSVTFQLGQDRHTTAVPAGGSGFTVMALNAARQPLAGFPKAFATNDPLGSAGDQAGLAAELKELAGEPGTTVLLQSVGRPAPRNKTWNDISAALGGLGADASVFLAMDGTGDYSMVGCGGCPGGQPSYNETIRRSTDSSVRGARLEGVLTRDHFSHLAATQTTAGRFDDTFADLSVRPDTAWPLADSAAVKAIGDKLAYATTCTDAALDRVRGTYCLQGLSSAANWSLRRTDLSGITYAAIVGTKGGQPTFTADEFDAAKAQLDTEFRSLGNVDSMIRAAQAVYTWESDNTRVTASSIAGSFQLPSNKVKKDVTGGIISMIGATFTLIKTVGPLVIADPRSTVPQAAEGGSPIPDVIEAGLGFVAAATELAGDSDDGSTSVSTDIRADASDYAAQLDAQIQGTVRNLSQVEDIIVADPVKLAVAAANYDEKWNSTVGSGTAIADNLQRGITRDLYGKLIPIAYEMWQWPRIPRATAYSDIYCVGTRGGFNEHYVYTGQPDEAVVRQPLAVGDDGAVSDSRTLYLTAWGSTESYPGSDGPKNADIRNDYDRVAQSRYVDPFLRASGYHLLEAATAMPFTRRVWPDGMRGDDPNAREYDDCVLRNQATGSETLLPRPGQ